MTELTTNLVLAGIALGVIVSVAFRKLWFYRVAGLAFLACAVIIASDQNGALGVVALVFWLAAIIPLTVCLCCRLSLHVVWLIAKNRDPDLSEERPAGQPSLRTIYRLIFSI